MAVDMGWRKCCHVLDNVKQLVVQQLFKLTKLGMSGVGYKLRGKIGKALKTRAKAIKKALAEYNSHAAELNLPWPTLTWTEVIDMVSLADFDILWDTRQDIRTLLWAHRANQQAINTYFNIQCAREEIQRLNVEIRRLFTFMINEHVGFYHAISSTLILDLKLAHELSICWQYRDSIHEKIVRQLFQTSCFQGFSGMLAYGQRMGCAKILTHDIPLSSWAYHRSDDISLVEDKEDEEDSDDHGVAGLQTERDTGHFVDFCDNLDRD